MRYPIHGEGRAEKRTGAVFWEAIYVIAILLAAVGGVFIYRSIVLTYENDTALRLQMRNVSVIQAALVREGVLSLADVEPKAAMAGPRRGAGVTPDLVLEGEMGADGVWRWNGEATLPDGKRLGNEPVTLPNGSTVQRLREK